MRRWRGTVVGRTISIMRGGNPASRLSNWVFFLVFLGFPFPFMRVLCIGVCGFPFSSFLLGQSAHPLSLRLSSYRHHPSTYSHSSSSCSSSSAFYHLISISHSSSSSHRRIVSISYARSSQHKHTGGSTNSLGPISSRISCFSHPSHLSSHSTCLRRFSSFLVSHTHSHSFITHTHRTPSRLIVYMFFLLLQLALRADAFSAPVTTVI